MTTAAEQKTRNFDPVAILDGLFQRAKQRDEFEYICALSGLYTLGHYLNLLGETWTLLRDVLGLINGPLRTETKLRLGLLLYCHLLEAKPIYAILDNMLSAVEGDRCNMDPFFNLCRPKNKQTFLPEHIPPSAKKVFETVTAHARQLHENDLADLLDAIFDDSLRNAFFHADYCIEHNAIQSRHSWFRHDNVRSQSLPVDAAFTKIQNALAFYAAFEHVYVQHRLSYQEPKKIRGRFTHDDSYVDIYVYVDPNGGGLTGFGNMPDAPQHRPSQPVEQQPAPAATQQETEQARTDIHSVTVTAPLTPC